MHKFSKMFVTYIKYISYLHASQSVCDLINEQSVFEWFACDVFPGHFKTWVVPSDMDDKESLR